jgi:hypothetical protein
VDSGLQAGDRLIMDGLQKIKPGESAEPVPWQAATTGLDADAHQPGS